MNSIEREIIQGISAGNRETFNLAFRVFYPKLLAYALDILKNQEPAREIVQELFIKLWEQRNTFQITTSLSSYLFKSVYHSCLNYIRNERKLQLQHVSLDQSGYLENFISTEFPKWMETETVWEELELKLKQAIDELPDQCREIFLLCRRDNLSYPEIAHKLNISISTVKTQMGRAMAKLKAMVIGDR